MSPFFPDASCFFAPKPFKKSGCSMNAFSYIPKTQTLPGGFISTTRPSIIPQPPFSIIMKGGHIRIFDCSGSTFKVLFGILTNGDGHTTRSGNFLITVPFYKYQPNPCKRHDAR